MACTRIASFDPSAAYAEAATKQYWVRAALIAHQSIWHYALVCVCLPHDIHGVHVLFADAQGEADRVLLGLLPSSELAWPTAVAALKPQGGWMHVHGNVNCKAQTINAWAEQTALSLRHLSGRPGLACCARARRLKRAARHAETFHQSWMSLSSVENVAGGTTLC